jgi:hypothetical protein
VHHLVRCSPSHVITTPNGPSTSNSKGFLGRRKPRREAPAVPHLPATSAANLSQPLTGTISSLFPLRPPRTGGASAHSTTCTSPRTGGGSSPRRTVCRDGRPSPGMRPPPSAPSVPVSQFAGGRQALSLRRFRVGVRKSNERKRPRSVVAVAEKPERGGCGPRLARGLRLRSRAGAAPLGLPAVVAVPSEGTPPSEYSSGRLRVPSSAITESRFSLSSGSFVASWWEARWR